MGVLTYRVSDTVVVQALGCGSGDVAGLTTDQSDSDCTLTLSDGESDGGCAVGGVGGGVAGGTKGGASTDADVVVQGWRRVAEQQGDWYGGAEHGMCLQNVQDSSEDDLLHVDEDVLWKQLYEEERRRKRPR